MPDVHYRVDELSGRTTFGESGHSYAVHQPSRGPAAVTLWHGDTIVAKDRVDLASEKDRRRFATQVSAEAEAVGRELLALAEICADTAGNERREDEDGALYDVVNGRLAYRKRGRDGDVWLPLCNFNARIEREVIEDDGRTERGEVLIAGQLHDGTVLPPARVPTQRFENMSWVVGVWGTSAVVAAGMGSRDRLREAIQSRSDRVERIREYTHPGWGRLGEGRWVYLHAGGAIGPEGPESSLTVRLRDAVARLHLPDPTSPEEMADAVRASLAILDLVPLRVGVLLLGATYRAPLQDALLADIVVFLAGRTGTLKSELSALGQQHFGAGYDRLHLPAAWSSTPNYLERAASDFKDALLVIDDFAPTGTAIEVARYHSTADRVLRGAGNAAGRGRMAADGTARPELRPRGLILSSGEDLPKGHSARARAVIGELVRGDVDLAKLTEAQQAAAEGRFALAMAGFVQWLAPQMEGLGDQLRDEHAALRAEATARATHPRTPGAVAHLALGWQWWLRYAVDMGALTATEAETTWDRVWSALVELGSEQGDLQEGEDPVRAFPTLLIAAISTGEAHLTDSNGGPPVNAEARGWRLRTIGTGESQRDEWQPQGKAVGWIEDDNLYLQPEASYAAAQRMGQAISNSLTVQPKTLAKRLHEARLLRSVESGRGRLLVRKMFGGQRGSYLHLATDLLTLGESAQPAQSAGWAAESLTNRELPPVTGPVLWAGFQDAPTQSAHETGPIVVSASGAGPTGPIGPVFQDQHGESDGPPRDSEEIMEWTA